MSSKDGENAVFEWYNNCESFACESMWFCHNMCNQPVQINRIVFLRVYENGICLDNRPDNEIEGSIICQFVS